MGGPKIRHVFCQGDKLFWRDPRVDTTPRDKQKHLTIRNLQLEFGRESKNFQRYKNDDKIEVSFTITGKERQLDLEAGSMAEKELFVKNLILLNEHSTAEYNEMLQKSGKLPAQPLV